MLDWPARKAFDNYNSVLSNRWDESIKRIISKGRQNTQLGKKHHRKLKMNSSDFFFLGIWELHAQYSPWQGYPALIQGFSPKNPTGNIPHCQKTSHDLGSLRYSTRYLWISYSSCCSLSKKSVSHYIVLQSHTVCPWSGATSFQLFEQERCKEFLEDKLQCLHMSWSRGPALNGSSQPGNRILCFQFTSYFVPLKNSTCSSRFSWVVN